MAEISKMLKNKGLPNRWLLLCYQTPARKSYYQLLLPAWKDFRSQSTKKNMFFVNNFGLASNNW